MTAQTNASVGKCSISYVYLEMVLKKDNKHDVVDGLFKGIFEYKDQKFILLHGLKNATSALSTEFYDVLSTEKRDGDYKELCYFQNTQIDQDLAMEKVEKFYSDMMNGGYGLPNDEKVIDVDKYSNVPKEYIEEKPIDKKGNTGGSYNSPGTRYNSAGGSYSQQAYSKPDPKPTLINRTKNKKPTKAALEIMLDKVKSIQEGNFEPDLPETAMDVPSAENDADDEDDYYGRFGIGCP